MPYQLIWAVPKRVLLTTFSGVISQLELQEFVVQMRDEVPLGTAPVYHISDSLAMQKVQVSLKALSELVKAWSTFSKLKVQIDVNRPSSLNAFMAKFGAQLIHIEAHTVSSLSEAVNMLKRIDANLADAVWNLPVDKSAFTERVDL